MRPDSSLAEVEAYLHGHIPLSADMAVCVVACDATGVVLRAPLAPNINHRATVFGGSASAVAILAAWTWLHFALRVAGQTPRLVIQRNTVDYLSPIPTEFEARCPGLPPAQFEKFVRTLARHGRSRATLDAALFCAGEKVAVFSGDYVALSVAPGSA
jgi:thioesterase domain-containing protein